MNRKQRRADQRARQEASDHRRYPEGKIRNDDEGEVRVGVATDYRGQAVIVSFEHGVKWFGLSKASALELAQMITNHANELPDIPRVNTPPAEGVQ